VHVEKKSYVKQDLLVLKVPNVAEDFIFITEESIVSRLFLIDDPRELYRGVRGHIAIQEQILGFNAVLETTHATKSSTKGSGYPQTQCQKDKEAWFKSRVGPMVCSILGTGLYKTSSGSNTKNCMENGVIS